MTDKFPENINILTVCTGNICRSPMAEGILKKAFENNQRAKISSAGTHALTGNPASEFAVISAKENGIDISGHTARGLNVEIIKGNGIILCMETSHIEYVLSLAPELYKRVFNLADFSESSRRIKEIPDPYGCSLREYRECFKEIETCITNFIESEHIRCRLITTY